MGGDLDAGLIVGLTLAVLGVLVVVLGAIAAIVLGPAVRRALAERRDEGAAQTDDSAQGAEHGDGGRG